MKQLAAYVCAALLCASPVSGQGGAKTSDLARAIARLTHPAHPAFAEEVSLESPNAAARYIALFRDMDTELAEFAGWVNDEEAKLAVSEYADDVTPAMIAAALERNEAWIRGLVEASQLERCDWCMGDDFRAMYADEEDPRRSAVRDLLRASGILRADSLRLWGKGERKQSLERLAAAVRLSRHYQNTSGMLMSMAADSTLGRALGLATVLLREQNVTQAEMEPLAAALARLDEQDPGRRRADWNRNRREVSAFAAAQLKDGAGWLLAYDLAQLKGIEEMVEKVFGRIANGDTENLFELSETDRQRISREIVKSAPALNTARLQTVLKQAESLGDAIEIAWSEAGVSDAIERAEDATETDKTGLLGYVLGHPEQAHRAWRERREQVQAVRKLLEAAP